MLQAVGFPDEAALHDLIEDTPGMLPLAGGPSLVLLGREVRLGTGYADLVAIEPTGRLAVIEIKLKNNPEARRAVVAQVLAYAAYLYQLNYAQLESLLSSHLISAGASSLADRVTAVLQQPIEAVLFQKSVEDSLASGEFRLVLVLDEVPQDLVMVVGYLGAVAPGIIIDLVTVSAYNVGTDRIMVPQRIEPERVVSPPTDASTTKKPEPVPIVGADEFLSAIQDQPASARPMLESLVSWALALSDSGLATLRTVHGNTRKTLQVRIKGSDSGLATVTTDNGGSIWLWPSVFSKRAPHAEGELRALFGEKLPNTIKADGITEALLTTLNMAYREATASKV